MIQVKCALLSVYNKEGIVELATALAERNVLLLCTEGTKKLLDEACIHSCSLEQITGFSTLAGGRVKTLHPAVFAAILSRRTPDELGELHKLGIEPIDMVVVNLYPFREMLKERKEQEVLLENIDIGGVSLIRAAAKNYNHCAILTSPSQYPRVIEELREKGGVLEEYSLSLAQQAFNYTASYECAIDGYFRSILNVEFPPFLNISCSREAHLRYGENPHQRACIYKEEDLGFFCTQKLHGKELSFNNILDVDAAMSILSEFDDECIAVLIKHTNPCGVAKASSPLEAYRRALASDPVSAFGAVVGFSKQVDKECAEEILKIFTEVVVAPGFHPDAFSTLCQKKNLRLLTYERKKRGVFEKRAVAGGLLLQDVDREDVGHIETVTKRKPTPQLLSAMKFGYKVVKHAKSNAIVVCSQDATFGIGTGCTSRIDAAVAALKKAADRAQGAVLASDAFFPFPDVVKVAAEAGISAIIQPGGSVRDKEVIEEADKAGICMVFTHLRHFLH